MSRAAARGVTWSLLLLLLPLGLEAQIQVTAAQGVAFGTMLPGLTASASRANASEAGRINLAGARNGQVLLQFTLPARMTGPGGATLPLSFGGGDAGYSSRQSIGNQTGFDPRTPFTARLGNNGRGSVFLGCTALPAADQPAGAYSATLILTVVPVP